MTAAGLRPARRARSTLPSVWPARASTPSVRARRGKTWPGDTRSSGRAPSATAALMVVARSAAEMPVLMPSRASMDTVKLVPKREPLCLAMRGSCSLSAISPDMGRQMRPRPNLAMKLMASGVTNSAAMVRSPSFSLSSSSTRMIILPCRISAMASSVLHRGMSIPWLVPYGTALCSVVPKGRAAPPSCQRGRASGPGIATARRARGQGPGGPVPAAVG